MPCFSTPNHLFLARRKGGIKENKVRPWERRKGLLFFPG